MKTRSYRTLIVIYMTGFLQAQILGVSSFAWDNLVDDIRNGRQYTVKKTIPEKIAITDVLDGKTPLQIAQSEYTCAKHHHIKKKIYFIIRYLEQLQLKAMATKVVYKQVMRKRLSKWGGLVADIKNGNLSGVAYAVPAHIKTTDVDKHGRTPLMLALEELQQKHRAVIKKRIKDIVAYLEKLQQVILVPENQPKESREILPSNAIQQEPVATPIIPARQFQEIIMFYRNDKPYYEFTNFYPIPGDLLIDDEKWHSVEHYYQAHRFSNQDVRKRIIVAPSSFTAYEIAQQNKDLADTDWDQVPSQAFEPSLAHLPFNQQVMLKALRLKFAREPFKDLLLNTGKAYLVYDAPQDGLWGIHSLDPNKPGFNLLGKMLMHVRNELSKGALLQFNPADYSQK